jgi:hypothetical protein
LRANCSCVRSPLRFRRFFAKVGARLMFLCEHSGLERNWG